MSDQTSKPVQTSPIAAPEAVPQPVPLTVPVAATAQRPSWEQLPAAVREWVEDRLGGTVVQAASQRSGYTPGFASRLVLGDGRRLFVKIAGWGRDWLLESYRNEAAKRRTLPAAVRAPELLDFDETEIDQSPWVLVVFSDIAGHPPRRPWHADEAQAAIAAVEQSAHALDPAPPGYDWLPLSVELGGLSPDKEEVIDRLFGDHRSEMRELALGFAERCVGDALTHGDLRDDNMIIDDHGGAWICDWNFPMLGKPYVDLVTLLISMRGDGLDTDSVLQRSPLVGADDADGIDSLLADLALYYAIAGAQPAPDGSPHLRAHQQWSGRVTAAWLADRRGW